MSKAKKRPRLWFVPEMESASVRPWLPLPEGHGSSGQDSDLSSPHSTPACSSPAIQRPSTPCHHRPRTLWLTTHLAPSVEHLIPHQPLPLHRSSTSGSSLTPPTLHSTLTSVSSTWTQEDRSTGGVVTTRTPSTTGGGPAAWPGRMETMRSVDPVLARLDNPVMDRWHHHRDYAPSMFSSSQHSLVSGYSRKHRRCLDRLCGHWNGYCKVFLVTCVVLLMAWAVAVPLYFSFGGGQKLWSNDVESETSAPESAALGISTTLSPSTTTPHLLIVPNVLSGSVTIVNRKYVPVLTDINSKEYHLFKRSVEALLKQVLVEEKGFERAVVKKFSDSAGAVKVEFVMAFVAGMKADMSRVHRTLASYLLKHWSMLGLYHVDVKSLDVNYLQDQCADHRGGCSHSCHWNRLSIKHECICPEELTLAEDGRTCVQKATVSPVRAGLRGIGPERAHPYDHNACMDGGFMCSTGVCVPRLWLCDGTPDCPHSEDEAPQICAMKYQPPFLKRHMEPNLLVPDLALPNSKPAKYRQPVNVPEPKIKWLDGSKRKIWQYDSPGPKNRWQEPNRYHNMHETLTYEAFHPRDSLNKRYSTASTVVSTPSSASTTRDTTPSTTTSATTSSTTSATTSSTTSSMTTTGMYSIQDTEVNNSVKDDQLGQKDFMLSNYFDEKGEYQLSREKINGSGKNSGLYHLYN